jgi:beta-fructofuranosidase
MTLNRRRFLSSISAGAVAAALARRSRSLARIDASQADPAHDPLRPECHLMPPHNWMNDPNGPIWWKGKYHLFYQLNPHAAVWGDMHWGHAISTDMVHWHHEPSALAPTPGGPDSEGCFSGSAVVMDGVPTFIYTGVQNAPPDQVTIRDGSDKLRETQLLAAAEDDNLLHWKKLDTPIINTPPPEMRVTGFRDPCLWREKDTWYLGLGSGERGKGGCVLLYRSQDLRKWTYLHKLVEGKPNGRVAANPCDSGEMWECPDFFALNGHHCLFYSTEDKVIWTTGDYDEKELRYTPKRQGVLDHGSAYYAPKSFLAPGGRRILWGWIRETRPEAEFAAAGWAGAMSLPRVLTIGQQGQLEMNPADEVKTLRGPIDKTALTSATPYRLKLAALRHEFQIPVGLFSVKAVTVRLLTAGATSWELTIDVAGNLIHCGAISFPLPSLPWPRPSLHLFLDGSVIESFIGGREAITSRVYSLKPGQTELEVSFNGEKTIELSHWALNPISPDRLTA